MYFKKLVGSILYLSPLDKNDYEKMTDWLNDLEVSLGTLSAQKIITLEEEKEKLEILSKNGTTFAIVDIITDKFIGLIGLPTIDYINRSATVATTIGDKSYWKKGYGTEAMNLVLDYCFNILNLHSVNLTVYSFNTGAIESYKKSGFKEIGRYREAKILCGKYFDRIIFDVLSKEFNSVYVKNILEKKFSNI